MKNINTKAMTLFELVAVILILGVITAIAFPSVNRLIENQKKQHLRKEQIYLFKVLWK